MDRLVNRKDKFLEAFDCVMWLRDEVGVAYSEIIKNANEYKAEFCDKYGIASKTLNLVKSDFSHTKYSKTKDNDYIPSRGLLNKWALIHYALEAAGELKEYRRKNRGVNEQQYEHEALYHYFVQHLFKGDYSIATDIHLAAGNYLLKRFSYTFAGDISISRLHIEEVSLYESGPMALKYTESKSTERGDTVIDTNASGYVVPMLGNYLFVGTSSFSHLDLTRRLNSNQERLFSFMILQKAINNVDLNGLSFGIVRTGQVPFATRVSATYMKGKTAEEVEAMTAVRKPSEEENAQITNQVDDTWKVLLTRN
ncbi:MAG: hypothetical protein JAY90_21745 [Candidatus Thiodiazotropha lotti]|nr:hypothetical protein [Candidatus Thiodiazotropha lotti]